MNRKRQLSFDKYNMAIQNTILTQVCIPLKKILQQKIGNNRQKYFMNFHLVPLYFTLPPPKNTKNKLTVFNFDLKLIVNVQ